MLYRVHHCVFDDSFIHVENANRCQKAPGKLFTLDTSCHILLTKQMQGQNLTFLVQLPAGLPNRTIFVALHMKYSKFQWPAGLLSEHFMGPTPNFSCLGLLGSLLSFIPEMIIICPNHNTIVPTRYILYQNFLTILLARSWCLVLLFLYIFKRFLSR